MVLVQRMLKTDLEAALAAALSASSFSRTNLAASASEYATCPGCLTGSPAECNALVTERVLHITVDRRPCKSTGA